MNAAVTDLKTALLTVVAVQHEYNGIYDLQPTINLLKAILNASCLHEMVVNGRCLVCDCPLFTALAAD